MRSNLGHAKKSRESSLSLSLCNWHCLRRSWFSSLIHLHKIWNNPSLDHFLDSSESTAMLTSRVYFSSCWQMSQTLQTVFWWATDVLALHRKFKMTQSGRAEKKKEKKEVRLRMTLIMFWCVKILIVRSVHVGDNKPWCGYYRLMFTSAAAAAEVRRFLISLYSVKDNSSD